VTLAIDPGPTESAYIKLREGRPLFYGKVPNEMLLEAIPRYVGPLVIEQVACFGKPVGADILETVFWSGRFAQAWGKEFHRIKRHEVKMHLCHATAKVTDAVIRQAIIDMFGGKDRAIGKKANPGPLYHIKADVWQALALGITFEQTRQLAAK